MEETSRTELLIGKDGIEKLKNARVAVFGVGGVGGYAVEALARAGVGGLDLFDRDTVSLSNINRQIIALHSTVGRYKCDVMKERILDINPECRVTIHNVFYLPENADLFPLDMYDYIVDAVDTVSAKLELVTRAKSLGVPIISSMGCGNRLDPSRFAIIDLSKTSVCPLARTMRRELKARGITHLKTLCSSEEAIKVSSPRDEVTGKASPGSISYAPAVAGLMIASEVIKDLVGE